MKKINKSVATKKVTRVNKMDQKTKNPSWVIWALIALVALVAYELVVVAKVSMTKKNLEMNKNTPSLEMN